MSRDVDVKWERNAIGIMLASSPEVRAAVNNAASRIINAAEHRAVSHRVTGNYAAGLAVSKGRGRDGRPTALVQAKAPHSLLIEYGTAPRHSTRGSRGSMPALRIMRTAVTDAGLSLGGDR